MVNIDSYEDWSTYQPLRISELSDDDFAHRESLELQGDLYPEDDIR